MGMDIEQLVLMTEGEMNWALADVLNNLPYLECCCNSARDTNRASKKVYNDG